MKLLIRTAIAGLLILAAHQFAVAQATTLTVQDTRSDPTTPSTYSYSLIPFFKGSAALGLPNIITPYYTTLGLRGWGSDNSGGKAHELAFADDSRIFFRSGNSPAWEGWRQLLVTDENGNLGIGTTNPAFQVDVNLQTVLANTNIGYNVFADATGNPGYDGYNLQLNSTSGNASGFLRLARSPLTAYLGMELAAQSRDGLRFLTGAATAAEVMRINAAGNVGIGTATPDSRLAVNGTIHAQEVKVDLTGWNDYVFNTAYHLPTLTEVKTYIDQNHHLPGMPTEAEVIKNGLKVGETEALLTKKVEELTLYLLDKDKEAKELKQRLEKQQHEIDELKKLITKR
jgi:hypothetical protein